MQWVKRFNQWIATKPTLPGVWQRRDGGFLIRRRVTNPKTGKPIEIRAALTDTKTALEAAKELEDRVGAALRGDTSKKIEPVRLTAYAVSLLAEKIKLGHIKSAKGREKWAYVIKHHLDPAFGEFFVDKITRRDIKKWLGDQGAKVLAGDASPNTVNSVLSVFKVIMKAYYDDELDKPELNPMLSIEPLSTDDHRTYTKEEPNELQPDEANRFLTAMRELYPQYLAMTMLGFATGLRPSHLRPLRRKGSAPDIDWETGALEIRRSQTRNAEPMERTKTGQDSTIYLPQTVVDVLKWHVENLPAGPMRDSDLLFPSTKGRYRSASCLDKPFQHVARVIGLKKKITPRGMRRTFNDLARQAKVADVVTRSISGHLTETMQRRYSTVDSAEQQAGIGKVIAIIGARSAVRINEPAPTTRLSREAAKGLRAQLAASGEDAE